MNIINYFQELKRKQERSRQDTLSLQLLSTLYELDHVKGELEIKKREKETLNVKVG